ncbi:NAD-dependent epimerase/dehydratase family protein [Janthinobacterium sp. LB3P112]|uniref:NAD-dependent epimerase/dehydratase family protein n=1 Tax=Janthinobacterium sp. LB3P112 TaxID=3424196 RepID=UPI003F21E4A3
MRLLLTGATGFLGESLVRRFLADGHQIVILKRRTSVLPSLIASNAAIVCHDVEDGLAAAFVVTKPDAVIHLATCYGRSGEDIMTVFETNTAFPLRLLQAARAAEVALFINTDTALEKLTNAYSLSKRQFAEWGQWLAQRNEFTFINVRLEHMFGPGDAASKFTAHVIGTLLENRLEINLTKGEQLRDFIYIDDVLSGYQTLLAHYAENTVNGYIECDLGSGEAITIKDFVELVHTLTNSRTKLNFGALPYRPGEVMLTQADTSYLKKLGWRVQTSLAEGIQKIIASEKIL